MSKESQKVDTATDPEQNWDALLPAVNYTSPEDLRKLRQSQDERGPRQEENAANSEPGAEDDVQTGAIERIRAEAPEVATDPDLPTGSVPVVPAQSKLGESGVGKRVRTYTSVSTGFIPLVREVRQGPKTPTLSDLSRKAKDKKLQEREEEPVENTEETAERARGQEYRTETTTNNKVVRTSPDTDADIPEVVQKLQEREEEPANKSQDSSEKSAEKDSQAQESPRDAKAAKSGRLTTIDESHLKLDTPPLLKLRAAIIALMVPVVTLVVAIRAVASNSFLWLEYHRPGFPADSFGFDTAERMRLGSYGLDYISNFAQPSYLERITTGPEQEPAFNANEVGHMHDVKIVMFAATVLALLLLILALLSSASLRERSPGTVRRSLFTGAWLTVAALVILGAVGATNWEWLFTYFHTTFFPQGNWKFYLNDTLIRLYPPQFWMDAALAVVGLSLLIVCVLFMYTWPTRRRQRIAQRRRVGRAKMLRKMKARAASSSS